MSSFNKVLWLLFGMMSLMFQVGAAEEVLFQTDLATPNALNGWKNTKIASFVDDNSTPGRKCLKITVTPENKDLWGIIYYDLDVKKFAGRAVQLEGWMRGENIGKSPQPWLGPKLMLSIHSNHESQYPDQHKLDGNFPWTKFTVFARITNQATMVRLSVGLEKATGTVYFRDLRIIAVPQIKPPVDINAPDRIQPETRYRGTMLGTTLKEEDIQELTKNWGANLVRFQMVRTWKGEVVNEKEYDLWLDQQLVKLEQMLGWAKKYGFKVVVDLHSGPFMAQNALAHNRLIWSHQMNDKMVEVWQKIAKKCKGRPEVYGYDLLNEPREDGYVYE